MGRYLVRERRRLIPAHAALTETIPTPMLAAQCDAIGGCVLFDAGDALRAGNRGNVVPLRKEPRQCDL